MMNESFQADCENCAALCCVIYEFTKGEDFPISKPAGEACPHLEPISGSCRIHATRDSRGFHGCIAFDCYGAGQALSHDLRASGELSAGHIEDGSVWLALRSMIRRNRQMHLLGLAGELHLSDRQRDELNMICKSAARPAEGWTLREIAGLDVFQLEKRAGAFLHSLRETVEKSKKGGQDIA